jgi:hypothetical protein
MTIQEWAAIPDNPIQRDTVRRAAKANHLVTWEPVHSIVEMAMLPDGTRYKLNGHTRVYKWLDGTCANPPTHVKVYTFMCRDVEVVRKLYRRFDSRNAVDNVHDDMFGAMRLNDIKLQSPYMRSLRFAGALRALCEYTLGTPHEPMPIEHIVSLYKEPILLLDSIMPSATWFRGGVMMAALGTLKTDGDLALDYWKRVNTNGGLKTADQMDGVEALTTLLQDTKKMSKKMAEIHVVFRKAITFYFGYRRGHAYAVYKRNTSPASHETVKSYLRLAFTDMED